ENVAISIQNNNLVVQGERKEEREETGTTRHLYERTYGKFYRSVPLPRDADPNKINAKMENGVLQVEVAKTEQHPTARRQIAIQ
ncbi:hypothetical protein HK102_008121, partial [Quaeritorhiza haematococci]